jgi:hypothetical protein
VENVSRRSFFRTYWLRQIGKIVGGFQDGLKEELDGQAFDDFFESYESSYALTLAYPDELLMETARQEGVEVEGREKIEIVKELFVKRGEFGHR